MKIQKSAVRSLEPFAIFCIIAGIGINIVVPLIDAFGKINSETRATLIKTIWFCAAFCGLVYSLIALRYLISSGILDRFLYILVAIIFVILFITLPVYFP
jgi:hypothetical protein